METKRCGKCRKVKTLDQFYGRSDRRDGQKSQCKTCRIFGAAEWAKNNPEKRKAIANRYYHAKRKVHEKILRISLKKEVYEAYGKACRCCGENEMNFLTLEHVNGDGAEHRRSLVRAGLKGAKILHVSYHSMTIQVYADLKKRGFPQDDYCLLCWNCHMATRNGLTCPHKEQSDGE